MERKLAFNSPQGKEAVLKFYDSLLEEWEVPNEKITVNTRFGETFMIACGQSSAPPLILLHGSAMNSAMWRSDALKHAESYRVYAIDIPGEPGHSDEHQLDFSGQAFAEWLDDVFVALGIEKADLIGISLGAWLALKFAIIYPNKVNKLAVLCPAGVGPQKKSFMLKAMLHMILGDKGMKALYRKVNGNQPLPEIILRYQFLIAKHFNFRRETIPLFSDHELKRLTMPVAVFVGEKDIMFHSDQTAARFSSLVPHADVNLILGAGHALINLTDEISEFLENLDKPLKSRGDAVT